jgi:hypothetical protein
LVLAFTEQEVSAIKHLTDPDSPAILNISGTRTPTIRY